MENSDTLGKGINKKIDRLAESLSPHELKILPHLEEQIADICKKTNLDKVSVLRALEYLQNKEIVKLSYKKKKIILLVKLKNKFLSNKTFKALKTLRIN